MTNHLPLLSNLNIHLSYLAKSKPNYNNAVNIDNSNTHNMLNFYKTSYIWLIQFFLEKSINPITVHFCVNSYLLRILLKE